MFKNAILFGLCIVLSVTTSVLVVNNTSETKFKNILDELVEGDEDLIGRLETQNIKLKAAFENALSISESMEKQANKVDSLVMVIQGKSNAVQVESGNISITKSEYPSLSSPNGCEANRGLVKKAVKFKEKFSIPPEVIVSLTFIDFAEGSDHRIRSQVSNISNESFELDLLTWCDTKMSKVEASWLAVGL